MKRRGQKVNILAVLAILLIVIFVVFLGTFLLRRVREGAFCSPGESEYIENARSVCRKNLAQTVTRSAPVPVDIRTLSPELKTKYYASLIKDYGCKPDEEASFWDDIMKNDVVVKTCGNKRLTYDKGILTKKEIYQVCPGINSSKWVLDDGTVNICVDHTISKSDTYQSGKGTVGTNNRVAETINDADHDTRVGINGGVTVQLPGQILSGYFCANGVPPNTILRDGTSTGNCPLVWFGPPKPPPNKGKSNSNNAKVAAALAKDK